MSLTKLAVGIALVVAMLTYAAGKYIDIAQDSNAVIVNSIVGR